jgi:hypothetical protein
VIAAVLAGYPEAASAQANRLATLIRHEAARIDVGPLTETLKWGEPAFMTEATKSGTTIRMAWKPKAPDVLQMLIGCQTSLVDTWRDRFPELRYAGNRAVLLALDAPLPEDAVRSCIALALTYHRR